MARAGINRAVVSAARLAVLARGENPSIDAIRIELGNTGSKTTIHRYLKEIEARQPAATVPVVALSDELGALVATLAHRLQEEAARQITSAREHFEVQLADARAAQVASEQRGLELRHALDLQLEAFAEQGVGLASCQAALQAEQTHNARLGQSCEDLQARLADKDSHIASLEEKHRHARDALERYRQSSEEQREQEMRRHEAQLQAVQAELRLVQQTLAVKQQEATSLNRDNERVLLENRQLANDKVRLTDQLEQSAERLIATGQQLAMAQGSREELVRQVAELRERLDQAAREGHRQARETERLLERVSELEAAVPPTQSEPVG
jgi:DNA repair exonuclease SbcCD ATPase subunit